MFIDIDRVDTFTTVGFLIERCPQGRASIWSISDRPAHTNRSREPRLRGWCGETNNVSIYARGLVQLGIATPNGRVRITRLRKGSEEEREALELLSYPDLA